MASNVIDLISSSPPRDVVHPQKQAAAKPDTGAFGLPHIEIQSDDFCSSGDDIFDGSQLDDEHSAKRPRLSLDRADDQQCRPSASSTVKPSCHGDGQSSKTASRDIEFISSFGSQTLASPKPRTTSLKRSRTEPPLPSSDPFASSPPKPRATTTSVAARAAQDLSSDPFASPSPIRGVAPHRTANTALAQGSENTQLARYPSSDPFATSSPVRIIASTRAPNPTLAREPTRQKRTAAAWDPISSSAPCSSAPPKVADIPSNRSSRSPSIISIGDSSASSDDELPAISNFDLPQGQSSRYSYLSTSAPKASSTTKSRRKVSDPQPQKARQTVDPAQRAAAAALKKQQKRDERERAKEERQRERDVAAAIVEVNKAKGNRKVSTREMIVEIPSCLPSTIKVQLETLLDGLEVQHRVYDNPDHNIVKWRRKVNSKFDDESGQWVPMPLRIETEDHALVFMDAEDMVQLALGDGLDEHMSSLRNQCPNAKLIYVLQGVVTWMRKNRNLRNRQFAAGVRSQTESQPASGRRRADSAEYVDEELVEDAILRLQVEHDVLIHHTAIPLETAQWISIFTQNISTIPYKRQKDEDTAGARFCMDNGQVKTGENAQDTYVRMLQEIFRVTAPIAYGVASEFDTVTKLVEGLQAQGPNALEGVRKSANKDGALSDRAIGQATSKRFYKIFTGTDETSTDV